MANVKTKISLLVALALLVLSGCSSEPQRAEPISFQELPGEIVYHDTAINLTDVSFGEVYANHGYTGYCVVTISRENISDDDVYWMLKRDGINVEFDVNAYLTSEVNALDSEMMQTLGSIYDEDNIYFFFYNSETERYRFDDFSVHVQMIMNPDMSITAPTTQYYYYGIEYEEGIDYSDLRSVFSDDAITYLAEALDKKVNG